MNPEQTVRKLIDAINRHNALEIAAFLAADHEFVDSLGFRVSGRDLMVHAWEGYFKLVPDYRIEIEQVLVDGETVVVLGRASGTYSHDDMLLEENAWSVPSVWRATMRDEHVASWQMYADNQPMRQIMDRNEREEA